MVDQHLGRTPAQFNRVAARLRDGQSALSVRRDLEEEQNLSRLKAGKVVEDVEKAITAWRVALGSGIGLVLFASLLFSPLSIVFWLAMLSGAAQFVAGARGMQQYRSAVDPDAEGTSTEDTFMKGSSTDF